MTMRQALDTGSTVIVAGVAMIMAAAYFQDRNPKPKTVTYESARVVPDWQEGNELGIRTGSLDADVVITEFVDLECPYCAQLAPTVDSILAAFPGDVTFVFHHFPLSMHEHAIPAAIAAECADRQERFWPMYRALLKRQDAFGSAPWESFAEEAGVSDMAAFSECVKLPQDSFPRIGQDQELGERTHVVRTPTTWVNGRVIQPTVDLVRKLLQEQTPG